MTASIYKNDIPESLDLGSQVAVDTETMGLKFQRDRLCLVQLADIRGEVYLVQIDKNQKQSPNLAKVMTDEKVVKIFHFLKMSRKLQEMSRKL